MIRLLAVDIDGTLLDSRGRLPDAHREAVVEVAAEGAGVALVTGRSFHFARPIADLLPIPLTLVVNNGALVKKKDGSTELRNLLPREVARHVLEGTRAFEDSVAIVFDRLPGDEERQIVFERMDWSQPHRRGYYEKNKAFIAEAPAGLAEVLTEDPVQLMFNGGVGAMRSLAGTIRTLRVADRLSVAITEYVARDFSLVDVNAAGCSKGTTLAAWVASRGWTREEVMAVGDNLNDVEMLDFAGTAVIMGNAAEALKDRRLRRAPRARGSGRDPSSGKNRWHVTGTNDEGGLATAIRRYALRSGSC